MSTLTNKPEWEFSEKPAIEQLKKMGYEYKTQAELLKERTSRYDVLLPQRIEKSLKKLNPWLFDEDIQEVIRLLRKFDTNIALEANETAYAKLVGLSRGHLQPITITQDKGDGKKPYTVKIFDFENPENNDFVVTNQFKLIGHKDDIFPDIVLFVNGIPLVVIECKSPTIHNPIAEAIHNNLSRYQLRHTGFEELFYYNQIIVAMCGTQAKYAPTFGKAHHYKEWKDPYPLTVQQIEEKFADSRPQEILIAGLFDKNNLLELVRNFIVFEDDEIQRVKKIAKYQQFRAVQKAVHNIRTGITPKEKGGVIWHTQGSGKSLTMLWLALQLKRKFGNPTVLVVTDRRQLDRQITQNFEKCGFPNPIQASDREDLKLLIENNKGQTVMTTIQKFPFFKNQEPHAVSNEEVFVMIDEGHRSQYGLTASDMRAALPNAIFFAYTGTPLMRNSLTTEWFGDYIDKYKLSQSEADGATVPIYYESRLTEVAVDTGEPIDVVFNRIFKDKTDEEKARIRKKYANPTAIAASPDRIKKVVYNILDHYENTVRPNGFKAIIVAPNRKAAVTYKEILDDLKAPESAIIFSEDPEDKKHGWDKYHLTKQELEHLEERFKLSIEEEKISIFIVVDMLLTGFDCPILQVMYLDQGLKEHTLLQAIARVNRPYGSKKQLGMIVDYWGLAKNLQDAFALYDDNDIQNSIKPLDRTKENLDLRHKQVMSYFTNIDKNNMKTISDMFIPDDIRTRFEMDYKQFAKAMDVVLPDPFAAKYRNDLSFLSRVRSYLRSIYAQEDPEEPEIGEKVRKLIEESIRAAETKQLIPPSKIDDDQFLTVLESFGTNKTKAHAIHKRADKVISENRNKNPVYYDSLRKRLEEIIEEIRLKKYEDAAQFKKLHEFWEELLQQDEKVKSLGFETETQFAIYNEFEKIMDSDKARKLTITIDKTLNEIKVIDWCKKDPIQKDMRRNIKDILFTEKLDYDKIQELANKIVSILIANECV